MFSLTKRSHKPGFTIMDVVTTAGIISVMTSIVVIAINPRVQFIFTHDSVRKNNAQFTENAELMYFKDSGTLRGDDMLNVGPANKVPICAFQNGDENCINMDDFVGKYLSKLFRDESEACIHWSGLSAYLDADWNVRVVPDHLGLLGVNKTQDITQCGAVRPYGIEIRQTDGSTVVTEGGAPDVYSVRLTKKPSEKVIITLGFTATEVNPGPVTLTFKPSNWGKFQTVTVAATDDPDTEAPIVSLITHDAASADANYNGMSGADVPVTVNDDDAPGVTVVESGGSTTVNEDPSALDHTDSYTVILDSRPTADVTVPIATDITKITADKASLTFTYATWNIPQTVTITPVDDDDIEGDETTVVDHTISTIDALYLPVSPPDVTVNVTDNDEPTIVITGAPAVSEVTPANSSAYQVRLAARPAVGTTVTITAAALIGGTIPPQQVTVNGVASVNLVFDRTTWNVDQTVQVRALDDQVAEGNGHLGVITHTVTASTEPNYIVGAVLPSVSATITDNDTAGLSINPLARTLSEDGASQTYTVVLTSQPRSDVTVNSTGNADVGVSTPGGIPFTFTPLNWNTARTITLTPTNDLLVEGVELHVIPNTSSSTDIYYSALSQNIDVTINDDEYGIVVSKNAVTVSEDGTVTDSFTVKLSRLPASNVVVRVTVPDPTGVYTQQTSLDSTLETTFTRDLTFTTVTWNNPQTVNVRGVNDVYDETDPHAGIINLARFSGPVVFNNRPVVNASIADDDAAGFTISKATVSVNEAGATFEDYTVTPTSRPTAAVVLTLVRTDPSQIATQNASNTPIAALNFSNLTWVAQTVRVRATDDNYDEADPHATSVTHSINTVTTLDAQYDLVTGIAPVAVSVADNDTAALLLSRTSSTADEGNHQDYTLRLATHPTSPVTVSIIPDGIQVLREVAPASVTFYPTAGPNLPKWNSAQTVRARAFQDFIDEPAVHSGSIVQTVTTTTDLNYTGKTATFVLNINDNDTANLRLTHTSGTTEVTEGSPGISDTYTAVLDSQPTAPVTVTLDPQNDQVTTTPTTLTFNPTGAPGTRWNDVRTVTVRHVPDILVELDHPDVIRHTAASPADPVYNGMVRDLNVTVHDDDTGIYISNIPVDVTEAAGVDHDDTFQVRLSGNPGAPNPVTVTLSNTDGQVTYSPPTLTFTGGNWNNNQTVTITAVDDPTDENNIHTGSVRLVAESTNNAFDGTRNITANITDNDTASIRITPTTVDVNEDGLTDSYAVVLTTQPTNDVTVNISPDSQVSRFPTSLTFTGGSGGNWATPQNVLVGAINDFISEGNHSGTITHSVSTSDFFYSSALAVPVTANITDNDGYTLVFDKFRTAVAEGGATDVYGIKLSRAPTAPVNVTLSNTSQTTTNWGGISFSTANWNTYQYITVTAVDDSFDEANIHVAAISHSAFSSDPNYNGITVPSMPVDITDNDTAGIFITETNGDTQVAERAGMIAAPITDFYYIRLTSQPRANVSVFLSATDVTTNPPIRVDFTTSNWSDNKSVSITGINDGFGEGNETINIVHNPSGDPEYDALADALLPVDVIEADPPGIVLAPGSITLYEAGTPITFETYTVRLQSQPTSNVRITPTPSSSQFTVTPAYLDFTNGNWDTPQTFRGQAIQDTVAEGNTNHTISHVATGDATYAAATLASASVSIIDDDPEIAVEVRNGGSYNLVTDGSPVGFGSTTTGTPVRKEFRIRNNAFPGGNLSLSALTVPTGYTIVQNFTDTDLAPLETATFTVELTAASAATFNGDIQFTNNDGDENPFNIAATATVTVAPQPEIEVYRGDFGAGTATPLPMNSQIYYAYGTVTTKVFTVRNTGAAPLTISQPTLTNYAWFSVVDGLSGSIPAGGYDTFSIHYNNWCTDGGCYIGVSIASNDTDENPYVFEVRGSSAWQNKPNMELSVKGIETGLNNPIVLCRGRLLPRGATTSVELPTINLGTTGLGTSIERTFIVRNVPLPPTYGTWPLELFNSTFDDSEFTFQDLQVGELLFAGESREINVRMSPTSLGGKNSIGILLSSDAILDTTGSEYGCNDMNIHAVGTAAAEPNIQVDSAGEPAPFVDGTTVLNRSTTIGSPLDMYINVRTTGGPLIISSPTLAGSSTFQIIRDVDTYTVAGTAYTWFIVRYNPSANGAHSTVVTIENNDPDEDPFTFTIQGSAGDPDIQVLDGSTNVPDGSGIVDFGVTPAASPIQKTLTIRNTGITPLSINTGTIGVPANFTITQLPSASVAPGTSTTMNVQFDARATSANGLVTIYSNDPDAESTYTFTVRGTATANPEVSVEDVTGARYVTDGTDTINFGSTPQGTPITRTLRIHNHGLSNLSLPSSTTWTLPSGFALVSVVPLTNIPPSGTFDIQVRLTAAAVNSYSGDIRIENNDSDEDPFDITLQGQVTVAPTPEIALYDYQSSYIPDGSQFNFGDRLPLGSTRSRAFTFFNTGNANLTLGTLTPPTGFTLVSAPVTPVVPGGTTSFTLQYNASTLVKDTNLGINITNNDANENPYDFNVRGNTTLTVNGTIYTSVVIGNILYVGGNFTTINSIGRTNLAAIDLATGQVTNWMASHAPNSQVRVLLETGAGGLYVGGEFTQIAGSDCQFIAILPASPGRSANCAIRSPRAVTAGRGAYAMALNPGRTKLFVGGRLPGVAANTTPLLILDTGTWTFRLNSLSTSAGAFDNGDVINAIAVDSLENVYVAGNFYNYGPRQNSTLNAAHFDIMAFRDEPDDMGSQGYVLEWYPPSSLGTTGEIRDVKLYGGNVYMSGNFNNLDGRQYIGRVAGVLAGNTLSSPPWQAWNTSGINGAINNMYIEGSTMYVAGDFTQLARGDGSNFPAYRLGKYNLATGIGDNSWHGDNYESDHQFGLISGALHTIVHWGSYIVAGGVNAFVAKLP